MTLAPTWTCHGPRSEAGDKDTRVANAFGKYEDMKAGQRIKTTIGRIIFNDSFPEDYPFLNYQMNKKESVVWSRTSRTVIRWPTCRRSWTA